VWFVGKRRGWDLNPPVVLVLAPVNTGCSLVLPVSSEASLLHKRTTGDTDDHSYTNALGARAGRSCQSQTVGANLGLWGVSAAPAVDCYVSLKQMSPVA
jgi:hypothetical protein